MADAERDAVRRALREHAERVTRRFADEGRLISAGWTTLAADLDWRPSEELRLAYFAGALQVFSALLMLVGPDVEQRPANLYQIRMISDELQDFADELMARLALAGRAAPGKGGHMDA
jgi:hypothetical protein